jgi:hypothetical protein
VRDGHRPQRSFTPWLGRMHIRAVLRGRDQVKDAAKNQDVNRRRIADERALLSNAEMIRFRFTIHMYDFDLAAAQRMLSRRQ